MNNIALVLDRSGSMSHLRNGVIKLANKLIDQFKSESQKVNQPTTLTLVTFGNNVTKVWNKVPIENVNYISSEYKIGGLTSLFSAVVQTINTLPDSLNDSNIVYVITDGIENASLANDVAICPKLLKDKQLTDRWSFIFQLPNGYSEQFVKQFNIPTDNVRDWENTEVGLEKVTQAAVQGFSIYYQARSQGKKAITNFFADLSKVDSKDINKLQDLSRQYKLYEVTKESPVREFVESKTKKPYVLGSALYQLYKKELVQSNKEVLLMEKGKKKVYQARPVLGLPNEDVRLDPYNLSKYDIFVQSTSVNRKLARGTKILVKV